MKTVNEIKEEIEQMSECLKDENGYLASETYGYIQALKWVLEDSEDENTNTL